MINQSSEFELEESKSSLSFQRSVSQLLFNYLPDKVVDWEDGLAVVQLGTVRLKSAWDSRRAKLVIDAVDQYLSRWVNKEGLVKHPFPPRGEAERFAVGEPQAISATFFETALVCTNCDHLSFSDKRSLGREGKGRAARICPRCGKRSLRQFPHMFVHGCGRADPLSAWIPTFKIGDSGYEPSKKPLKCPVCGSRDYLKIPAKSERVRDIRIYCEKCGVQLPDRLTARCEDCVKELNGRKDTAEKNDNDGQQELTAVARVAMRMTRYSATDAYYAHTITILRTDGVPRFSDHSVTYKLLSEILAEGSPGQSAARELERLSVELQEASRRGDMTRVTALSQEISNMVSADHSKDMNDAERASSNIDLSDDVEDSVREYLSFRTTVKSTPVMTLTSKSLSNNVTQSVSSIMDYLGIAELSVIDDLPIITATMGYSRRSPLKPRNQVGQTPCWIAY